MGGAFDRYYRHFYSEFQVWCSSVAWFWSYSLPKVSPNISQIGQLYVLSDSVPCLFMFIRCGIPKIELFCLLPSTKNFSIMLKKNDAEVLGEQLYLENQVLGEQLYLENHATYKHRTCTVMLRTFTIHM